MLEAELVAQRCAARSTWGPLQMARKLATRPRLESVASFKVPAGKFTAMRVSMTTALTVIFVAGSMRSVQSASMPLCCQFLLQRKTLQPSFFSTSSQLNQRG